MTFAGVYEAWAKAHAELMNATGWDRAAAKLVTAVKDSPDALTSAVEDVMIYVRVVNWREPFFRYLAAGHVALLLTVLFFTWGSVSDTRLELFACGLLILAQSMFFLNALGRQHAHVLFREPRKMYFDEDGLFVTLLLWAPITCLALGLILRVVIRFGKLLARVARKKATMQQRAVAKATAEQDQLRDAQPQPQAAEVSKKQQ